MKHNAFIKTDSLCKLGSIRLPQIEWNQSLGSTFGSLFGQLMAKIPYMPHDHMNSSVLYVFFSRTLRSMVKNLARSKNGLILYDDYCKAEVEGEVAVLLTDGSSSTYDHYTSKKMKDENVEQAYLIGPFLKKLLKFIFEGSSEGVNSNRINQMAETLSCIIYYSDEASLESLINTIEYVIKETCLQFWKSFRISQQGSDEAPILRIEEAAGIKLSDFIGDSSVQSSVIMMLLIEDLINYKPKDDLQWEEL